MEERLYKLVHGENKWIYNCIQTLKCEVINMLPVVSLHNSLSAAGCQIVLKTVNLKERGKISFDFDSPR